MTQTWQDGGRPHTNTMTQDEPRLGELIELLNWPWKLALALLLLAPLPLLLEHGGWLVLPWAGGGVWGALALAGGGALLALLSGLQALRGLLTGTEPQAAPVDTSASEIRRLTGGLLSLLDEQRMQTHDATLALSRSVASGVQLAGIARALELQCKQTLAAAQAGPTVEGVQPVLAALRQTVSWVDAELGSATARFATMAERAEQSKMPATTMPPELPMRLEALLERLDKAAQAGTLAEIEHSVARLAEAGDTILVLVVELREELGRVAGAAQRMEGLEASLQALPAAALRMDGAVTRLEASSGSLAELPVLAHDLTAAARHSQAALAEAAGCNAARETAEATRLAALLQERERNEATLGDAARYLSETTDRLQDGVSEWSSQAVRLQAMTFAGRDRAEEVMRETLAALTEQIAAVAWLGQSLEVPHKSPEAQAGVPLPFDGAAARLLAELEPAGLPLTIRAALRTLSHVENQTARLLCETEALAQGSLLGDSVAFPTALSDRAPDLLRAVEDSIRRLNSAATALALASDGSACKAA